MFRMDFTVEPGANVFERYSRAFSRYGQDLRDFSELFERMADDFYAEEARQFGSEGASGATGAWAELAPGYAKRKLGRWGFIRPILRASGELAGSFERGGADNVTVVTETTLTVGSDLPRARYHQTGTDRMPARPPIALSENFKRVWDHTITAWLREKQARTWSDLLAGEIFMDQQFIRDIESPHS